MDAGAKPIVWLHGEVKSPPFSLLARIEAGALLRHLQLGDKLSMPRSRPMPSIGPGCHELRIEDSNASWRVVYFVGATAILVLDVFEKKTRTTPSRVIDTCRRRLMEYVAARSPE